MPERLKLSVGYQLPDADRFADVVTGCAADIDEVYFPWRGAASGRGVCIADDGEQSQMMSELAEIRAAGVRLNMLWNGNCYGCYAIASALEQQVVNAVRTMSERIGLDALTTASPFIAERVKRAFPALDVRASVNMGVRSITAMKCLGDAFDSYYAHRGLNRFPKRLALLHDWCAAHNKRLYLLANSGCIDNCPAHVFHDNLVAHETEAACRPSPWNGFSGVCWSYYADPANRVSLLTDSTWLRPEEIDRYAGLTDGIKLATRVHRAPARVIAAYARRAFDGNMLSLCEPDFSALAYLDNTRFSDDWLTRFGELPEAERIDFCEKELRNVSIGR